MLPPLVALFMHANEWGRGFPGTPVLIDQTAFRNAAKLEISRALQMRLKKQRHRAG